MMKIKLSLLAVALSFSCGALADDASMSREQHQSALDRIKADYEQAKERCETLKGNQQDICEAEAEGREKVARAELEAQRKNTDRARRDAAMAKIEAEYEVAKERCDDASGNQKDACLKSARTEYQSGRAELQRDTAAAGASGAMGNRGAAAESRTGLSEEQREERRELAEERCDQLTGDEKGRCLKRAGQMH